MTSAGFEKRPVPLTWVRLDNRWYRQVREPGELVELRPCAYGDALGVDCGVDYYSRFDWVVPPLHASQAARTDCEPDVVLYLADVHRYTARLRPPAGLRVDGDYAYCPSAPHRYFNDWGPDLSAARYQMHFIPQPCVSVMLPAGARLRAERPVGARYQLSAEARGGRDGEGYWTADGTYPSVAQLTALRPHHRFAPGRDGVYERWCLLPLYASRARGGHGTDGSRAGSASASGASVESADANREAPVEVGSDTSLSSRAGAAGAGGDITGGGPATAGGAHGGDADRAVLAAHAPPGAHPDPAATIPGAASTTASKKRERTRAKHVLPEVTARRMPVAYAPGRRAEACLHAAVATGVVRPEPPRGTRGRPLGDRSTTAASSSSGRTEGSDSTETSESGDGETAAGAGRSAPGTAAPASKPARKARARNGPGGRPPPRTAVAQARRSRLVELHPAATVRAVAGCCPTGAFFGCPLHTLPLHPHLSEQGYVVVELDDPLAARPAPDVHDALAWALGRVKPTAFRTSTKVTSPHALQCIPRRRLRQFLFEWHMEELVEVWRVGDAEYRRVAAGQTDGRTGVYAQLPPTSVPAHWRGGGDAEAAGSSASGRSSGGAAGAANGSASVDDSGEADNPPSVAADGEFSHRLYWSIARAVATAGLRISPGHSFACEGYPLASLTEREADLQPSHVDVDAESVDIQPRSGAIAFANICRNYTFRICVWPRSHLSTDLEADPPDGVAGTLVEVPPGHLVVMDYRLRHCGLARPPGADTGPQRVFRPWVQFLLTTQQAAAQGQRLSDYHRNAVRQGVPMANTSSSRRRLGPADPNAPMMVAREGPGESVVGAAGAAAPAGSASGAAAAAAAAAITASGGAGAAAAAVVTAENGAGMAMVAPTAPAGAAATETASRASPGVAAAGGGAAG